MKIIKIENCKKCFYYMEFKRIIGRRCEKLESLGKVKFIPLNFDVDNNIYSDCPLEDYNK